MIGLAESRGEERNAIERTGQQAEGILFQRVREPGCQIHGDFVAESVL